MGAHENLQRPVSQIVEHLFSPFAFHHTRQQSDADVHALKKAADGAQVLFGKNLGWRHDTGLIAIVECHQHGHECHQCLARTHVAL